MPRQFFRAFFSNGACLRRLQLTFLRRPFVLLTRMLYPILELPVIALGKPRCNGIHAVGRVHAP